MIQKKLKGATLAYVLMISLIISTLLGSYILINYYQHVQLNRQFFSQLARHNLESGLHLFLRGDYQLGDSLKVALFEEELDSTIIRSERWGLLGLVHASGSHSFSQTTASLFIGQKPQGEFSSSLYLTDQQQPLVLSGKTHLAGPLRLPLAGLKTGYVNRRGYENTQKHYGSVSLSSEEIPKLKNRALQAIRDSLARLGRLQGVEESYFVRGLELVQPWEGKPYLISSQSKLLVEDLTLAGKCLIKSHQEIEIYPSANLTYTLIFAPKVTIKSGFSGIVQVFATEEIILEERVSLDYPSVLMLQRKKEQPGRLYIEDQCKIIGAVVFDAGELEEDRADICYLGNGTLIGNLYASHGLDIRGEVRGNVITNQFTLKTAGATYKNHLIDARLDYMQLSSAYVMPILQPSNQWEIIHYLAN